MDHDLLMMVYGALIGVGSSIITTLFQSWLARREREQQRKEEKKREYQKIQIPTIDQINAIRGKTYPHPSTDIALEVIPARMPPKWLILLLTEPFFLLSLLASLLVCGGVIYLFFWIDNPILYLVVSGLIGFSIFYIAIKRAASTGFINTTLLLLSLGILLGQSRVLLTKEIGFQSRISYIFGAILLFTSIIIGCYIAWVRLIEYRMTSEDMRTFNEALKISGKGEQKRKIQETIRKFKNAKGFDRTVRKYLPIQLLVCALGLFFIALAILFQVF